MGTTCVLIGSIGTSIWGCCEPPCGWAISLALVFLNVDNKAMGNRTVDNTELVQRHSSLSKPYRPEVSSECKGGSGKYPEITTNIFLPVHQSALYNILLTWLLCHGTTNFIRAISKPKLKPQVKTSLSHVPLTSLIFGHCSAWTALYTDVNFKGLEVPRGSWAMRWDWRRGLWRSLEKVCLWYLLRWAPRLNLPKHAVSVWKNLGSH